MKVSSNWLREYIDITLPLKDLAHRLTMSGTEVDSIEVIGEAWKGISIGEIVAVEPHPNADRLKLVTIDLGKEQATVVCGAPNVRIGEKVPFARVGSQLVDSRTGQTFELRPATIRDVASDGMACSEKELGISESHEGLMILPPAAPVGVPLADYLGDAVLDLEVTPNRPDCLSHIGIAWEVAALTKRHVRLPAVQYPEEGPDINSLISVEIEDPALCRRYCASFIEGIQVGPSPAWMQQRLAACGMRPINNIVDITNYVMLEYGQPLHAFDFPQVGDGKIVVRRAAHGEKLTTLDGVDRTLAPDMLAIADSRIPIALAGVMGGADTEIIDISRTVLLESANFQPASIRRTSTILKLRSEASVRFERGISPDLALPAIRRATQLIVELAGGKAARGIVDVYPGQSEPCTILLTCSAVRGLLGIDMKMEQMVDILTSLGFGCEVTGVAEVKVTVPYWRMDVRQRVDLIEELARTVGYDFIPTTMLSGRLPGQVLNPVVNLRERLRDMMVGCGFQEIISYSLISKDRLNKAFNERGALRVANPLSAEQEYLRTSLFPSLLYHLASNQRHEEAGIRLFELGRIYMEGDGDLPEEREMLNAVLSGSRSPLSWLGEKGEFDFFDAKGVVDTLFERLGVAAQFRPVAHESLHPSSVRDSLHPGRSAEIVIEGTVVGILGETHPRLCEVFDLARQTVALFEIDIEKLLRHVRDGRTYRPVSRFPASSRDLALVLSRTVPVSQVKDIIMSFQLVTDTVVFDIYVGEQIASGKKSLAIRVTYQSPTHTLTDAEVEEVEKAVLARLSEELGATLRS